jgi:uncharacterized Zn-finger protein
MLFTVEVTNINLGWPTLSNSEIGNKSMSQSPVVMIDGKDLPLHCPTNQTPSWNSHPRVFLDVAKTGDAKCPYCGTEYKLIPGTELHGH